MDGPGRDRVIRRSRVTTAVFALAEATAGPQVARLVEDRGQRRVLPWSVAVFVLAVSGLIVGARLRLPLAALASWR